MAAWAALADDRGQRNRHRDRAHRGARVSANGHVGGGTVALGTTVARARPAGPPRLTGAPSPGIPAGTARQVLVETGATVSANGRGAGSGGTVTALSTG